METAIYGAKKPSLSLLNTEQVKEKRRKVDSWSGNNDFIIIRHV